MIPLSTMTSKIIFQFSLSHEPLFGFEVLLGTAVASLTVIEKLELFDFFSKLQLSTDTALTALWPCFNNKVLRSFLAPSVLY